MTSAIDHNVKLVCKKDDSILIKEKSRIKHCINQINAKGITDEITIIIKNAHIAKKGLEQKILNKPLIRDRLTKRIS
jgi:hypothetical protein